MEARGNNRPAGQSLNSEINITPLVDVMLVVLIIFIVVTPLLQQGVGVDLPQARNVEDASEDTGLTLTVVLQGNGRMFLGTDPIDQADLAGTLRMRHQADPGLQFQVKADRSVHYGEIKQILQAGRAAGFRGASLIAREIKPAGSKILPGPRPAGHGD
ncbi:MAG: biopolymer transporter ExbD [Candidatus Eisenbacteria sp.]|nr:biopolymer transporter ExbD [Candidatus Eisenbacteria bacterium]